MTRKRLDLELVRRGLVQTPEDARVAIDEGRVTVSGRPALRAETLVSAAEAVALAEPTRRYVSRGGDKLAAALDRFAIDPAGKLALDAGASTGGFTDVLLIRGASRVVAVDVGYGQLAWPLRTDERVHVMERTNVRELGKADLPYEPELVTADLSFISLAKVVPVLVSIASEQADLLLLVKPQFEAERQEVRPGGVVDDPSVWRKTVSSVSDALDSSGAAPMGVMASPLPGPSGNVEFFIHALAGGNATGIDLDQAIREGEGLLGVRGEAS